VRVGTAGAVPRSPSRRLKGSSSSSNTPTTTTTTTTAPVAVAGECGQLRHAWVLPHADLVLAVAVR
jgi:hypothetical protein